MFSLGIFTRYIVIINGHVLGIEILPYNIRVGWI